MAINMISMANGILVVGVEIGSEVTVGVAVGAGEEDDVEAVVAGTGCSSMVIV